MNTRPAGAILYAAIIAFPMVFAGCDNPESPAVSGDEKTFLAQTYCLDGQPNDAFVSREAACEHFQSHFGQSKTGNPHDFFEYIASAKNLCAMSSSHCLPYWSSVSDEEIMKKMYPGIDVQDPRIWAAKKAAVQACIDDSHPVAPDGHDVKPEVCLQAARLLRGDNVAPASLRKVEHRACDLGDPEECHNATMDGEVVDIKASEAAHAAHEKQQANVPAPEQGAYDPNIPK